MAYMKRGRRTFKKKSYGRKKKGRITKKSFGRKGGLFKQTTRRQKVAKWRRGKKSGYKLVKKPRRGKNKVVVVKKMKVKR